MTMSFAVFIVEFLLYSWSKSWVHFGKSSVLSRQLKKLTQGKSPDLKIEGYVFSFYFYLDALAIVSMFPDIPWIADTMGIGGLALGPSSEVGATAKLGRVTRMVRLVRLVKLYKAGAKRIEAKKRELELIELVVHGVITAEEFQERQSERKDADSAAVQSKVGAQLSDTTTRRVIAIVLLMLCFVPLLGVSNSNRAPHILTASLQHFNHERDAWGLMSAVDDVRSFFAESTPHILSEANAQPFLVYLEIYPGYPNFEQYGCNNATPTWTSTKKTVGVSSVCVRKASWVGGGNFESPRAKSNINDISEATGAQLRPSEVLGELDPKEGRGEGIHYSASCCLSIDPDSPPGDNCAEHGPCYVRYKFNLKVEAMDTALLSVVTIVFIAFMLVLGAHTFTVDAERLVLNPIQEMMSLVQKVSEDPSRPIDEKSTSGEGQYETRQIENAIKKITDLLRIGFGVAGSEIIRANLSQKAGTNGESIDLLTNPGARIYSVFGFCMIEVRGDHQLVVYFRGFA